MTYILNSIEYLDDQELRVFNAIKALNQAHRTTNTSQVAAASGISRTTVTTVCHRLKARGFIKDVSKGAAYHWRIGTQPVPYPVAARHADRELARRQRELNEQIREGRS